MTVAITTTLAIPIHMTSTITTTVGITSINTSTSTDTIILSDVAECNQSQSLIFNVQHRGCSPKGGPGTLGIRFRVHGFRVILGLLACIMGLIKNHQGPTRTPSDMNSETPNLTQKLILIMWTLPAGSRQGCREGLQHLHSRKLAWKPQKGPIKTTVLLKGYSMGFHVSLGECITRNSTG